MTDYRIVVEDSQDGLLIAPLPPQSLEQLEALLGGIPRIRSVAVVAANSILLSQHYRMYICADRVSRG